MMLLFFESWFSWRLVYSVTTSGLTLGELGIFGLITSQVLVSPWLVIHVFLRLSFSQRPDTLTPTLSCMVIPVSSFVIVILRSCARFLQQSYLS